MTEADMILKQFHPNEPILVEEIITLVSIWIQIPAHNKVNESNTDCIQSRKALSGLLSRKTRC